MPRKIFLGPFLERGYGRATGVPATSSEGKGDTFLQGPRPPGALGIVSVYMARFLLRQGPCQQHPPDDPPGGPVDARRRWPVDGVRRPGAGRGGSGRGVGPAGVAARESEQGSCQGQWPTTMQARNTPATGSKDRASNEESKKRASNRGRKYGGTWATNEKVHWPSSLRRFLWSPKTKVFLNFCPRPLPLVLRPSSAFLFAGSAPYICKRSIRRTVLDKRGPVWYNRR